MTNRRYETDDDDAYDERGLIKDGKTVRTRLMMMDHDSVQYSIAMQDALRKRDEARALYELDLANRWRGGVGNLSAGDVVAFANRPGVVASHDDGKLVITDGSLIDAQAIKQQMYSDYDADISSRWMRPRDADQPRAGSECSYGGYPGHYERDKDGELTCVPDDRSDRENAIAGPLSDAERVKVKDAAYEEYASNLRDAWRR